jgi:hypothetical protein
MARKRNKYGAKKVHEDGFIFDSKLEHARYQQLSLWQRCGEIKDLVVHPKYVIHDAYVQPETGKRIPAMTFTADFSYVDIDTGKDVVEDVKSPPTARKTDFVMRRKMFEARYGIRLTILMKEDIL